MKLRKETIDIIKKQYIILIVLFLLIIFTINTSLLASKGSTPFLLAHRGLAQNFPMEGIQSDTNTAARIYPPEYPYLENTIESIQVSFDYGADMVELDVQLTKDGLLAVFHDHLLEYRTNATGIIADYNMEELKKLDIGYGYTADDGKTFPFRGKGVGLMPCLEEVLDTFPEQSFLIHLVKANPDNGRVLADLLLKKYSTRINDLAIYGGDKAVEEVIKRIPNIRAFSINIAKKGFIEYLLIGWTGYVPESLRNRVLYLPIRYAHFLWGWPHRFIDRMKEYNSQFFIVNGNGKWTEGFDSLNDLSKLPKGYSGGIWTNRIDILGPCFKKEK